MVFKAEMIVKGEMGFKGEMELQLDSVENAELMGCKDLLDLWVVE